MCPLIEGLSTDYKFISAGSGFVNNAYFLASTFFEKKVGSLYHHNSSVRLSVHNCLEAKYRLPLSNFFFHIRYMALYCYGAEPYRF